jgi:cytochrome P450
MLGGFPLERGTDLFISPYVMHHLPGFFAAPYEFRPERFTSEFEDSLPRFAYMPFGGGPRVCIGNSFAMMEAQLVLATISSRFALAAVSDAAVAYNPQITLSIKNGLKMRLHERSAQAGMSVENGAQELVAAG